MFLTTTIKRGNLGLVWDKPVPDSWLCFCPNFLSFCWSSLVAFEEFTFQKLVTNQQFELEICPVQQDTFYPLQDYEQINFYKKSSLYFIGWTFRNWKISAHLQLAENWNISTKVWQNLLFLTTFPTSLQCYAKRNKKSRVCAMSKLWIYWFDKNNGTKYLLYFDDSCEEICSSKAFVDIATAGRHRGLSTIYVKHNLFHQSKLGGDVELQNTHLVLFKSPRDVMQVTTLSTELGLGSELVDWYWDARSVPFGHLLIDLSPRTDDRLRYCTNSGSFPSKISIPDRLKLLTTLDDEHTKSLYSPGVPIVFPQVQKSLPQSCPKEFIRFLCECMINLLKGNLQSIKRHHVGKIQDEVWLLSLKRTTWKQRRNVMSSEKRLHLIAVITLPVINHLSWYGAVCSCPSFCV